MILQLFHVLVLLIALSAGTRHHRKLAKSLPEQAPGHLSFVIKESARRHAFEKVWREVQDDIKSGDKSSGIGLFPDIASAFPESDSAVKQRRYKENFVPDYNNVIFLPRHPVVTGINFFALLSQEEKSRYLGANVTERYMRTVLQEHAPGNLEQYDLEQTPGYRIPEKNYYQQQLGGFSNEVVNFTREGEAVRNTGAYHTAGIFSALSVLETVYSLKTIFTRSENRHFSRQFLVDCLQGEESNEDQTEGITKWFPHEIFTFLHQSRYLPFESDEKYTGIKNECQDNHDLPNAMAHAVKVVGSHITFDTERGMLNRAKGSGPVSVCIHVNDHIFFYESGLSNECVAGIHCNHFVTLQAYTKEMFTVQNSWGTRWGLQGRMNMLRGNCADNPSGSRFIVTSVTLTIMQDEEDEEERQDWGVDVSHLKPGYSYMSIMMRDNLIIDKDYLFPNKIQVGDVIILKAKSILEESGKGQQLTYFSLLETESAENIPYHILLDLKHHEVSQTYYFGHQHAQFPKLVERLHREEIYKDSTVISIHFTRTAIHTRVNNKDLRVFYHQADIKTIGKFEVHGPKGWFESMQHLRPQEKQE